MAIHTPIYSQQSEDREIAFGTTIYSFPPPLDNPTLPFSIVKIDENTPDWAHLMYSPNANFTEVDYLYNQWRKENPDVKGDHVRNYRKLSGYLIRNNAIDEDGYVSIPSPEDIRSLNKKIIRDKAFAERQQQTKSNSSSTSWQYLGPDHMQDTKWDGSNSQINIYSITQSLSNTDILYATSESGAAVYKTTDNGYSWQSVSDNLITSMGSRNIEVAASDPDIVYLCTKHDIYKTTVGGNTWTSIYYEYNSDNRTFIINPTNPDTIMAGGDNGILKSVDGGNTWTNPLPDKSIYDIRYKPGSTSIIYALVDNDTSKQTDFYKSTDGGKTWTIRSNGWPNEASTANRGGQMTTSDGHPNIIFAFVGASWTNQANTRNIKILKSSDGGESWTTKVDYDNIKNINSGQGYYDWDIEMSDIDSNIVACGTQGSWISYDGFETVTADDIRHSWSGHADIQEMLFNGTEIWVSNDGGIIKYDTDSLYNWTAKSRGISSISYWGYDHGWNKDVGCGVHYHNGTSVTSESYNDSLGINLGGAEPHFAMVSINGDRVVSKGYGSVNGYNIAEEKDGSFSRFSYNLTPNVDRYFGNNGAIHPAYSNTHYQPYDNKLVKTTDFGVTWDTVYTFPSTDDYTWDVRMSRANLDLILVSTLRSNSIGGADVYKSLDGGATFVKLDLPIWFDNDPKIINVVVSNDDAETFYIMKNRYGTEVAKTTDGGLTWTNLTTSTLDGYGGSRLMINEGTNGGIYLIAGKGVFYRNNTMTDWILITDGIPANATINYIHPFYRDGEVRLVTNRGVFGAPLHDTPILSQALLQQTVDKKSTLCSRDTFYFDDYSIVNHANAQWAWSFPGASYVSNTAIRNPKVVYSTSGDYDVTMSITQNGNTYTKTMAQMVSIDDKCGVVIL